MFTVQRVPGWRAARGLLAGGLLAGGLVAVVPAGAQSNGPSTTGGALPYIIGTSKSGTNGGPPLAQSPIESTPATPGVRVIDLTKRDPSSNGSRPMPPEPDTGLKVPAPPAAADRIAATPPEFGAPAIPPPSATAAAPAALARATTETPKPRAKPTAKVAARKPLLALRPPAKTARIQPYDQDVEIDVVAPRPLTTGRRARLAGYDPWGRPIYFGPDASSQERRWTRGPRPDEEAWGYAPAHRLRSLPPVGALRSFPPGAFHGASCRVVFFTDELGYTRRETRCR